MSHIIKVTILVILIFFSINLWIQNNSIVWKIYIPKEHFSNKNKIYMILNAKGAAPIKKINDKTFELWLDNNLTIITSTPPISGLGTTERYYLYDANNHIAPIEAKFRFSLDHEGGGCKTYYTEINSSFETQAVDCSGYIVVDKDSLHLLK